jgi:hypothetical protein
MRSAHSFVTPSPQIPSGIRRVPFVILVIALFIGTATTGCLSTMSRRGWNDSGDHKVMAEKKLSPEDMAWLRSSTTVFFLPAHDVPNRAQFEEALARVWTLTPIKVVPYQERANYMDTSRYSYLTLAGVDTLVRSRTMTVHHTHIFLKLMRITGIEDGEAKGTNFCRIDLHPDYASVALMQKVAWNDGDAISAAYAQGVFRNFSPAHIALYMRAVQTDLESATRRWEYEEIENKDRLQSLKTSTLYIPDYVLNRFDPLSAEENERHDPAELFSRYRGKYQIVSPSELNRLLLEGPDPVFVFDFVRSSSDKFVAIYERKAGLIYRAYHSSSYNLDKSDFDLF